MSEARPQDRTWFCEHCGMALRAPSRRGIKQHRESARCTYARQRAQLRRDGLIPVGVPVARLLEALGEHAVWRTDLRNPRIGPELAPFTANTTLGIALADTSSCRVTADHPPVMWSLGTTTRVQAVLMAVYCHGEAWHTDPLWELLSVVSALGGGGGSPLLGTIARRELRSRALQHPKLAAALSRRAKLLRAARESRS